MTTRIRFGTCQFAMGEGNEPSHRPYAARRHMPSTECADRVAVLRPPVDVMVLQECFQPFLGPLKKRWQLPFGCFAPEHNWEPGGHLVARPEEPLRRRLRLGNAALSLYPLVSCTATPIIDFGHDWEDGQLDLDPGGRLSCMLLQGGLVLPGGIELWWATIRGRWSADGSFTAEQSKGLRELLGALDPRVQILAGDLNTYRGGPGWEMLARAGLHDRTDPQWDTTLDPDIHLAARKFGIRKVVDGFFTRDGSVPLRVLRVRLVKGIGDHYGIVADLEVGLSTTGVLRMQLSACGPRFPGFAVDSAYGTYAIIQSVIRLWMSCCPNKHPKNCLLDIGGAAPSGAFSGFIADSDFVGHSLWYAGLHT